MKRQRERGEELKKDPFGDGKNGTLELTKKNFKLDWLIDWVMKKDQESRWRWRWRDEEKKGKRVRI